MQDRNCSTPTEQPQITLPPLCYLSTSSPLPSLNNTSSFPYTLLHPTFILIQNGQQEVARNPTCRSGDRLWSPRVLCPLVEAPRRARIPRGVLPLKDLEECGVVRETGFVWMKQKAPYEHFFVGTNTLVRYDVEVTAYVEKGKMKKMSGVKSKQLLLWVPIVEMSVEGEKMHFKTPMGIGRSFPITAFMDEEEKQNHKEKEKEKHLVEV
ncbi:UNVERIFIED_CONTAM: hypothetical protein Scaly_0171300 [Sesamum calycinum]|uniref:Uncharacterized protein n=1 Tax=Sesamum calycinum TaxID=2727403 RepID=A0AAW2SY70_9LAMI